MTDGQTYYDGLIAQGYPADQALGYTQQYYPGFAPAAAAPTPMPAPAPMPAQPAVQPQAIPQPQPMAQPMVQPMAQTIPQPQPMVQQVAQPMMNTAPVGMAPMGMAPMAMAPIGEKKPIMAWAAVSCIILALILTCVGQFGNSWLVQDEDSVESGEARISMGLSGIVADCSDASQQQDCIDFSYSILSEDMAEASKEVEDGQGPTEPKLKGEIENYCENIYSITIFAAGDNTELRSDAGESRENCLSNDSAGGLAGTFLWLGIFGALVSAVMLTMATIGKELPGHMQNYGRISSWVSGGVILLGAIIWTFMKYDYDDVFATGSSFYMVIFAGILAVSAGVLDMLDKRE